LKIGSIVLIKEDLLGISDELIGLQGSVVSIETFCEGDVVAVSVPISRGNTQKVLYFQPQELQEISG
jgi:hypothetical protein